LKQVGLPVSSGGEFPVSVAFNSAGDTLCAVNGGEVIGVKFVPFFHSSPKSLTRISSCFKVDQSKGLVPISETNRDLGLNQTTPANGPPGTVSHIVFSEDDSQLIASVKGVPPNPGFLAIWDVAADGSLSQDFHSLAPSEGGLLPFSMTLIKGKNAILATDAGIGFDIFDLGASAGAGNGSASAVAGGQSSANAIDGQVATCWSSFSPKTGNFYLTDIGTSIVTEVNVDDNLKGSLVKVITSLAYAFHLLTFFLAIPPRKRNFNDRQRHCQCWQQRVRLFPESFLSFCSDFPSFMYVLQPGNTAVSVLSLNAPGQAQNIQSLDIAGPAKAAGLTVG